MFPRPKSGIDNGLQNIVMKYWLSIKELSPKAQLLITNCHCKSQSVIASYSYYKASMSKLERHLKTMGDVKGKLVLEDDDVWEESRCPIYTVFLSRIMRKVSLPHTCPTNSPKPSFSASHQLFQPLHPTITPCWALTAAGKAPDNTSSNRPPLVSPLSTS